MKAVIYARYSSDNQREASIEGQLRECLEYAEKNGRLKILPFFMPNLYKYTHIVLTFNNFSGIII